MLMKLKLYTAICTALLVGFTSCIDDESGEGGRILPELSIPGSNAENMPIKNFNLGTECVIDPQIQYNGDKNQLSYTWSMGRYVNNVKEELTEISKEPVLRYLFKEGGSYYVHLNVTDGKVGQVIDYQVNINRTFEEGFILTSNDESQKGNIAFVKTMTPEEIEAGIPQVYMEHCITTMNPEVNMTTAVNASLVTTTWPKTLTRLTISTDKCCFFLNPNTFTVLTQLNYEDIFPGFNATSYISSSAPGPYAYDSKMGKFVHLDLTYMFPYEYKYFKDAPAVDDIYMSVTYSNWGTLGQDPFFVRHDPAMVALYTQGGYFVTSKDMQKKDILEGKEVVSAFFSGETNPTTYGLDRFVITRSKNDANKVQFYQLSEYAPYGNPDEAYMEVVKQQELTLTDDMAMPVRGTRFMQSPTYKRYFYALGSKVYVFLNESNFTFPKKSQPSISFPDNEEVTYLDVNTETEELYVATYNTTTKRGNLYIFNTADVRADNTTSPEPKTKHIGCADRITNILYKKSI